jgi:hypothetical protein
MGNFLYEVLPELHVKSSSHLSEPFRIEPASLINLHILTAGCTPRGILLTAGDPVKVTSGHQAVPVQ